MKDKILHLKSQGIKQSDIAKMLNITSSKVSYYCNPKVKANILKKRRLKRILNNNESQAHKFLSKELDVEVKAVNWKLAETLCIAKLVELGYEPFLPVISNGEIDVIATKNGTPYRIQIKSKTLTSKSTCAIPITRNSMNYKDRRSDCYKNIDFFMIYDGTNYFKVPLSEVSGLKQITLRYKIPRNNSETGIRMASDYLFVT